MARNNDVVSQARQATAQIAAGLATLRELQREIDANGGGVWLDADALEGHDGITSGEVTAMVYDTRQAIDALLADNGGAHAGNVYRLL